MTRVGCGTELARVDMLLLLLLLSGVCCAYGEEMQLGAGAQ